MLVTVNAGVERVKLAATCGYRGHRVTCLLHHGPCICWLQYRPQHSCTLVPYIRIKLQQQHSNIQTCLSLQSAFSMLRTSYLA
jgi:hypothetical protein